MIPVLNAAQMRICDKCAEEKFGVPQQTLMQNAARALYEECLRSANGTGTRFTVLCGPGNNGGDGFCLAGMLRDGGYAVSVIAVLGTQKLSPAARLMYEKLESGAVINAQTDYETARRQISEADIVIDCIFGTGFRGSPEGTAAKIIELTEGKEVISADIPSGVACDSGAVSQPCVKASKAVTFAAYKPFCFTYPAKDFCGRIILSDIGMPCQAVNEAAPTVFALDEETAGLIKKHGENTHKGSFGAVQTVCGSVLMTGAAILCADAALHSGAGMVYMTAGRKVRRIFQAHLKEPVFVPYGKKTKADSVIIGCGLGKNARKIKFYISLGKPAVIDADAITYISKHRRILENLPPSAIITPHPAEMARLLRSDVKTIESDRISAASGFAQKYGVTVVLKGHHTVIAAPDGKSYINTTGNAALSKAGSGDILAGLAGGLLAQGYSTVDAAILSVYLHGKAADLLRAKYSRAAVLPSDLPREIGKFIN